MIILTEAEAQVIEATEEPQAEPTARELWDNYAHAMEQWLWSASDGDAFDWWTVLQERAEQIRARIAEGGDLAAEAIASRFEELSREVPALELLEWLKRITAE